MSRAYYAVFHAARAMVLASAGLEAKTHGGLASLFGQYVVRAGLAGTDAALQLTRLYAYRQASDYAFEFVASADAVRAEIDEAKQLVAQAKAVIARP